jgi:hypothetical protein
MNITELKKLIQDNAKIKLNRNQFQAGFGRAVKIPEGKRKSNGHGVCDKLAGKNKRMGFEP